MLRTTIAFLFLLSTGCYHASIETGMKPGSEKIEKEWASSFIFGLVPPDPIDAKSKCTSGVSKVETQHSFLNALVAFFTLQNLHPDGPHRDLRGSRKLEHRAAGHWSRAERRRRQLALTAGDGRRVGAGSFRSGARS